MKNRKKNNDEPVTDSAPLIMQELNEDGNLVDDQNNNDHKIKKTTTGWQKFLSVFRVTTPSYKKSKTKELNDEDTHLLTTKVTNK